MTKIWWNILLGLFILYLVIDEIKDVYYFLLRQKTPTEIEQTISTENPQTMTKLKEQNGCILI